MSLWRAFLKALKGFDTDEWMAENSPSSAHGRYSEPHVPELIRSAHWIETVDGFDLTLEPFAEIPSNAMIGVLFMSPGSSSLLRGQTIHYVDRDGAFIASAYPREDRTLSCFIPYGAVRNPSPGRYTMRVVRYTGGTFSAWSDFNFDLPQRTEWSSCRLFRPLVGLAMAVARADGVVDFLEEEAILRFLTTQLELSPSELEELKLLMKTEPRDSVEVVAATQSRLFPTVEPMVVLEFLAGVARADGHIDPEEVAVIRSAASGLGLVPQDWPKTAQDLGLRASERIGVTVHEEAPLATLLSQHTFERTLGHAKLGWSLLGMIASHRALGLEPPSHLVANLPRSWIDEMTSSLPEDPRLLEAISAACDALGASAKILQSLLFQSE